MDPLRTDSAYNAPRTPAKKGGCFSRGCTGCSLGCGLLMLILFVSMFAIGHWITAPADVTPAQSMVGPKDRDILLARFDNSNPGASAVVIHILDRALLAASTQPRSSQAPMSPEERAERAKALTALIPRLEVAVTARDDGRGGAEHMSFFSAGAWKNILPLMDRWIMSKDFTNYRDKHIRELHNDASHGNSKAPAAVGYFCPVGGSNLIVTDTETLMKESIDRFLSPSGAFGGGADMKALFDAADPTRPVVAIDTSAEGVHDLLHTACSGDDSIFPLPESDIDAMATRLHDLVYSIDFLSADKANVRVLLDTQPGTTAKIAGLLQHRAEALVKSQKVSDGSVKTEAARITLTFTINDLARRTDKLFAHTTPTDTSPEPGMSSSADDSESAAPVTSPSSAKPSSSSKPTP